MLHVNIKIMTSLQRWYLLLSYFNNKINFLFSCEIRSWSLRFRQFDMLSKYSTNQHISAQYCDKQMSDIFCKNIQSFLRYSNFRAGMFYFASPCTHLSLWGGLWPGRRQASWRSPLREKREVKQHLRLTATLHLSHPWGCALGQPMRQASALAKRAGGVCYEKKRGNQKQISREGGTCHLGKKERRRHFIRTAVPFEIPILEKADGKSWSFLEWKTSFSLIRRQQKLARTVTQLLIVWWRRHLAAAHSETEWASLQRSVDDFLIAWMLSTLSGQWLWIPARQCSVTPRKSDATVCMTEHSRLHSCWCIGINSPDLNPPLD